MIAEQERLQGNQRAKFLWGARKMDRVSVGTDTTAKHCDCATIRGVSCEKTKENKEEEAREASPKPHCAFDASSYQTGPASNQE